jgi:hypothetical protein
VITDQHVNVEAADRVFERLIRRRCAEIAYGRPHFDTELLLQFVRPIVKFLAQDVYQDEV